MAKKQNVRGLAVIAQLAEQLGVDLKDTHLAVATDKHEAKARFHDGSLEVTLLHLCRPTVRIESPRAPGIYIEVVDHQRDVMAPQGAIYCITAYMPDPTKENAGVFLNGDAYSVYVGKEGILLCDATRKRVTELLGKK